MHVEDPPSDPPPPEPSSPRGLEARGLKSESDPLDRLEGSHEHRRFVVTIALGLVFLVLAAFAFNLYADPLGTAGTGRYRLATQPWLDHIYKMQLLRHLEEPPDLIVYGTSTATDIPRDAIEDATDDTVFNASVSNGAPLDTFLLDSYVGERFGDRAPKAIFGLDVSAMQQVNPDPSIIQEPDLRRQLPLWDRLRTIGQVYKPLLDIRRLPVSWRTVRQGIHASKVGPVSSHYDRMGFSVFPYPVVPTISPGQIKGVFKGLVEQTWRVGRFDHLDDEQLDMLERFLRNQNERGQVPVVYFPPLHPDPESLRHGPRVSEYWSDWHARHAEMVKWLDRQHEAYEFEFYDFTDIDSIHGDPKGFRDELHMDVPNMRLLVKALDERGAFETRK